MQVLDVHTSASCLSGWNTVESPAPEKQVPKNKRLFFFSYQDFDSKKLMENKHNVIGNILNNVADQAETFANNIGLFSAIDSVVQGM